jgi:hypothetical protein
MAEEKGGSEIERSVMTEKILSRINEHKNAGRVAVLMGLVVAAMGPWTFTDLLHVPSEYSCSAPFIRFDDDFCGTPLSGIWILLGLVTQFIYASAGLVTGAMGLVEWASWALFSLFPFLLVLPFFSTLLLILRGDRRRRQAFNVAAWGLAAGTGLTGKLTGFFRYTKPFWLSWGIWLYIGLAASALTLEVLALVAGRRPNRGSEKERAL